MISRVHDVLPYATKFWRERCLQFSKIIAYVRKLPILFTSAAAMKKHFKARGLTKPVKNVKIFLFKSVVYDVCKGHYAYTKSASL